MNAAARAFHGWTPSLHPPRSGGRGQRQVASAALAVLRFLRETRTA